MEYLKDTFEIADGTYNLLVIGSSNRYCSLLKIDRRIADALYGITKFARSGSRI
jgi:hypothetical protein